MTRISAIKDAFYEKLHSIERAEPGITTTLAHIKSSDETLQELRDMLGIKPQEQKPTLDGRKVRKLLRENGLVARNVDEAFGKYTGWANNLMNRGKIKQEHAEKLAAMLNVTTEEIME